MNLFADVMDWFAHPLYSEGTIHEWLAAVILLLLAAFGVAQIVNQID